MQWIQRFGLVFALVLALAVVSPVAMGDIVPGTEFTLVDGDLDQGLAHWSPQSTDPAAAFAPRVSSFGRNLVRVSVGAGHEAWLEQSLALGSAGLDGAPSDVWLGQQCAGRATGRRAPGGIPASGSMRLELLRRGPSGDALVGVSPVMDGNTPAWVWKDLVAEPLPGSAGHMRPDTTELVVRLVVAGPGTFDWDGVNVGDHAPVRHAAVNGGFERGSAGWVLGAASVERTRESSPSRRGRQHLKLLPGGQASTRVGLASSPSQPWIGEQPVMGAWLRVAPDPSLPLISDPNRCLLLELVAQGAGGVQQLLSQEKFCPTQADGGVWRWIETPEGGAIPGDGVSLRLSIVSSVGLEVLVDEVALGAAAALDGSAGPLQLAAYAPWYRNPVHPDASGNASGSKQRWGNWAWADPSPCDPGSLNLTHDPDFTRINGRRDGATSTVDGVDSLPLVGLYDSRDQDVTRLSVDLARAAGLDGFVVDWHGLELDSMGTPSGEAPRQWQSFLELVNAADRPGVDFDLAPMLEPKVQQAGWLDPSWNLLQRRDSLLAEVTFLVRQLGDRRCMLRLDGEMVFFVFWHNIPGWDGQRLEEGDWQWIIQQVESSTGEAIAFIATHPPDTQSTAFSGYGRWHLIDQDLLRFSSFANFQSGSESNVPLSSVTQFARGGYEEALLWRNQAAGSRKAFGLAWWGFDDSGVAGWSSQHGLGSDGQSLCLRVSPEPSVGFLEATQSTVDEGGHTLLVSWNDWNERTALEPAWNEAYWAQLQGGLPVVPADREASIGGLMSLCHAHGGSVRVLDSLLRRYALRVAAGAALDYD